MAENAMKPFKMCPKPAVQKLEFASESPGELVKTPLLGPTLRVSDLVGQGLAENCISSKSQETLGLLALCAHVENYCCRRRFGVMIDAAVIPLGGVHIEH